MTTTPWQPAIDRILAGARHLTSDFDFCALIQAELEAAFRVGLAAGADSEHEFPC